MESPADDGFRSAGRRDRRNIDSQPRSQAGRSSPARPGRSGSGSNLPAPAITCIDDLKDAIIRASPGSGQVQDAIRTANFTVGIRGYTSLLQSMARDGQRTPRAWEKALEIRDAIVARKDLKQNVFTYSALISAMGVKWEKSLEIFQEQKKAAEQDPCSAPNTITYSALISSCERAGRLDKALELYHGMRGAGLEPDFYVLENLVTACEKKDAVDEGLELLEAVHAAGYSAKYSSYAWCISQLGRQGKFERALELFLELQMADLTPPREVLLALLSACTANHRPRCGRQLLEEMVLARRIPDVELFTAALESAARAESATEALKMYESMQALGVKLDSSAAHFLLTALKAGDPQSQERALKIAKELKEIKIVPAPPRLETLGSGETRKNR